MPYTGTNVLSAPQISLPSRSGHISPSVAVFLARYSDCFFAEPLHLHFDNCNCGTFSSRWSAWIFGCASRCVLASIASDDPHVSVLTLCLGFHTCAMRFTALLNVYSVQVPSFPVALRMRPRPSVNLQPGVRILSPRA